MNPSIIESGFAVIQRFPLSVTDEIGRSSVLIENVIAFVALFFSFWNFDRV